MQLQIWHLAEFCRFRQRNTGHICLWTYLWPSFIPSFVSKKFLLPSWIGVWGIYV